MAGDMRMNFAPWQQAVLARVLRVLAEDRLGHALLFAGPARLGKAQVAHALAARLLCRQATGEALACGHCRGCTLLAAGTHPDYMHLTFEPTDKGDKLRTELVVDQVRKLGEWLSKTPQFGGPQVAIVEPAHMLNAAAANALLKTLEEPSSQRYLLLVTDRPERLPATIRSRCQRLVFAPPDRAGALAWLASRGHAAAAAEAALDAARGHPGLADAWLGDGGLALREQVRAELDAVGRGRAGPIETAQRWLADEHGEQRLRFAADLVLDGAAHALGAGAPVRGGLAVPADAAQVATWFDALNRMRSQLPAPLRHDLILAGLLRDWRAMLQAGAAVAGQGGGR
jgi:DNA polymerase-3 subunit delta'